MSAHRHPLLTVVTVALGLWIVAVTWVVRVVAWAATDRYLIVTNELPNPGYAMAAAVVGVILTAGPAALVTAIARRLGAATIAQIALAWTAAGLAGGAFGALQSVPILYNEAYLFLTAIAAASFPFYRAIQNRRNRRATTMPSQYGGFGVAAGLLTVLPWLWLGALGGLAESVLALAAGLAVGWFAATLLGHGFYAATGRSHLRRVLIGALATVVVLVPIAGGLGAGAIALAELLIVPTLGFAVAAVAGSGPPLPLPRQTFSYRPLPMWSPFLQPYSFTALAIGVAAAGPLMFVDPEETSLILGSADVALFAATAAAISTAVAVVVGLAYLLLFRPRWSFHRWIALSLAGVVALAAGGVYFGAGQPGFHGDRLFVVLKDQASLAFHVPIRGDRTERAGAVYRELVAHAERTQRPLRSALDALGLDYQPYYLMNAISVRAGLALRGWLLTRSDVSDVLLEQRLRPLPEPAGVPTASVGRDTLPKQWNIEAIGATRAWERTTGQGIVIGISDSGVDGTHPALRNNFRGGDDSWYDPWNGTATPTDHNGHGTHALGTAVGGNDIGVAPGAQWMGCVNLDRNLGSPSQYLDCLQFMLAPFPPGGDPWHDGRPARAAHILTNSWACPELEGCGPLTLDRALDALRQAGIYVVVAAGNTGPECNSIKDTPAVYPGVLTVGATDSSGQVPAFSSRGPAYRADKPDLMAPGVDIVSAWPGGGYQTADGTSMATPHVAGAVALLWSAHPQLVGDIDRTTELLQRMARPIPSASKDCGGDAIYTAGAGLLDVYAAINAPLR